MMDSDITPKDTTLLFFFTRRKPVKEVAIIILLLNLGYIALGWRNNNRR